MSSSVTVISLHKPHIVHIVLMTSDLIIYCETHVVLKSVSPLLFKLIKPLFKVEPVKRIP